MTRTAEEILNTIYQTYYYAQSQATIAQTVEDEDAAELQYYANICYSRYQKAVKLVNSGELEEAEKLIFGPLE